MEVVALSETASVAENQPVEDPPSFKFSWNIKNFSNLKDNKPYYSDFFFAGGYKWGVLIYLDQEHLSMYLVVVDSAKLPWKWCICGQFSLTVICQSDREKNIRSESETHHQFNARESCWGFQCFMPLSILGDPHGGYIVNDIVTVEAEVAVKAVYDSKKETGYVGLKEKRPNCYLNSLLQTLYHIPLFRKVVYHIPTTEKDMLSGSTTLALQSLFYELQYSDTCVAIKELRKYFAFMQHGALEFNRLICEKLEDKMEGTVLEGRVHELFKGMYISSLECINMSFKCSKWVPFHGLQLDVEGCRDVYASFDKIVQFQCPVGVEKHFTTHGLQDARRSFLFLNFPRILLLELKRFEYDEWGFITVKVNDRYEYPLQLDLDRDNGKYLSPKADRRVRNLYNLHSVLVHSAEVHSNPYCAFIRPTLSDQWFKFYDERVTEEDTMRALQEQYGGAMKMNLGFNNSPYNLTNYSNAYMLVYIRESDEEDILCSVNEDDLAEHLRSHLRKRREGKEHKKREKVERRLYTVIKVARDVDLFEQIGRDIYFGLVDHDKLTSFRIQNQVPFILFKEEVAKEFGIPVQYQRFWLWTKEHNGTYRPLTCEEEQRSVGQLKEVSNEANNTKMKLLLEVELGPDLHPISLPVKKTDDILLFFKLFIPEKHELRYVGRLFVKGRGKPVDILTKLNAMAGFDPNEDIDLYLEIKFDYFFKCEHIDRKLTFRSSQIKDGDIICFQKCPPPHSLHIDVPLFLEYVYNHQVVRFRSLEKPNEDAFSLELSKLYTYDDIVKHVSRKLLLLDPSLMLDDPSKIRLTSHDLRPIKYLEELHLSDMLVCNGQTSDILSFLMPK
ncbi:ubiquitin C-terminal hydrolase 12-like [Macadamia integrifolia]|uniref:ubiquitin C-terminal hydrolase 12-like n=1 Tax=Macadamia integrifolia TaxID=60698 RepID=UPI001C4EE1F6|nr:ubiquitin C-terminal hydrolase 12-like [Macadamia integrifolia]